MSAESEAESIQLEGVEYRPHSMIHKSIVQMDATKLEMLDGFDQTDAGHKFVPEGTNVRLIITGKDWGEKQILVYGCKASDEAMEYINTVISKVRDIDHDIKLVSRPEIVNIAVSGDFGRPLNLEELAIELPKEGVEVEYEPEQFPAAIVKFQEPSATFLLFSNGKFSIQGLKSKGDIVPQINRIVKLIWRDNST